MNIDQAFPSNYIKASDLGENEPVVTIREVKQEAIGRNKEIKPVMYFEGKTKGLVMNKTNAKKIADLTGSKDTEDWPGHKIRLYATETEFAGEMTECIRIKAAGNGQARPVPPPSPPPVDHSAPLTDDDIPF